MTMLGPPPHDQEAIIRVRDLVVGFGEKLIMRGLSLDVYRGEVLGFVGGSGQGKSVLTRTILGLVPKREGTIEVFGESVDAVDEEGRKRLERRYGVMFQGGALFSGLTVKQNVQMPMREHLQLSPRLMDELALLKIEGDRPFPTLPLGDSDRIRVGEWVMAVGDPLQFEKTVTVGVVSGKGRAPQLSQATRSFENLIQTDAAINFGNSGGPLVNTAGEAIGINTAISRFAQNIGFAVPINLPKKLLSQLKEGKVVRGFLGVSIGPVEADMQDALGLPSRDGALVQSVEKGMPADKAGIRHGDVIVRVDQTPVKNNRDLIDYVSGKRPGTKVTLTFLRDGKEKTAVATLETRREEGETPEEQPSGEEGREKIGISLEDLSPVLRRAYSIGKDVEGVVLTHVKNVSAAADAGLREGDVIQEVNGRPVTSV